MRTTSSADSKEFEEGGIPLFAPSGPMQSVWPSGLRRQLQVLFFFGRRGFEPLSGHFDAGKLYLPLPRKSNNKKKNPWPKLCLLPHSLIPVKIMTSSGYFLLEVINLFSEKKKEKLAKL